MKHGGGVGRIVRVAAMAAGGIAALAGVIAAWTRLSQDRPARMAEPGPRELNPRPEVVAQLLPSVAALPGGPPSSRAPRRGIFYGWWVLAAMTILLTVGSALAWSSFTFYITPMEDEFGWSRTQTSVGAVITMVCFAVSAPITGWWIDRRGARSALILGVIGTTAGFLLLAQTATLWQFYLYWAVVSVSRTWIAWIPAVILASRWFRRRRGLALGIVTSGAPIGTIVILPYLAAVIERMGWQAGYALTAVALPVVFLPLALFVVRERPEDHGLLPDGDLRPAHSDGQESQDLEESFTAREALRTASFWIVTAAFLFLFMGHDSFMPHQAPFFESRGMTADETALILAAAAVAQLLIRAAVILAVDRWRHLRLLCAIPSALIAASIAIITVNTGLPGLVLFVLTYGAGMALGSMTQSLILSRYFGTAALGRLTGVIEMLNIGGVLIGPILGGVIFDETGSYAPALVFYAASIGLSAVLYLLAVPPKRHPASPDRRVAAPALP
jgi:MFS family permease